ncbi:MAG: hypothetical protein LUD82_09970 [Clostridiales bacterium]|nr:hypothetical protein [Clostridiales bacterium]
MRWLEIALCVIALVAVVAVLVIAAHRGLLQPFGAYLAAHAPELICGVPLLVIGLSPNDWGGQNGSRCWYACSCSLC